MTLDEARSHHDRMAKAMNSRDLDTLLELYSDKYVGHVGAGQFGGRESLKRMVAASWASFPDLHYYGEVIAAAGDSYTCRYSNSGTHRGVFLGKAPTGKHFEAWGLSLCRVQDGKFVESWTAFDELGRRVQLGLLPDLK
jgi:predicted ester cyclase